MARMYPARLHVQTQSQAERKLYEAFAQGLPNDYAVFHSVAWLARDLRGGAEDGEADFIIAHPERGVLVVEVKGGHIRYDGAAGQWYSHSHAIKDPFEQARSNKYSLLEKLKDLPYWRNRWLTIGHAVAFPDIVVTHDLRLDAPQDIILDAHDLADLRSWVERVMAYWQHQGAQAGAPGLDGVQELIRLLSPSWELHAPLALEFADEAQAFIRLTDDQFDLLDFLSDRRRVAISGCAGSGKTTMAVEQARRLARQGFRVLLTCFNRHLAEYLRSDDSLPAEVTVLHFHGLCMKLATEARLIESLQQQRKTQAWYDQILPESLLEAAEILGAQYDAIVVDEGQDFMPHWWLPLQYLLQDPERGVLYIFHDDNQNIFKTALDLPDGMESFRLRHNCRNTQYIYRTFLPFYRSGFLPTARGPEGRPPRLIYYRTEHELRHALRRALHELTVQEAVPSHDIVILTPRTRAKSLLWNWPGLGNLRITDRWPPGSGEIYATSVYLFKGLESPVILLAELYPSSNQDLDAVLYVGCSRARNHLYIFAEAELPAEIRDRLPSPAG